MIRIIRYLKRIWHNLRCFYFRQRLKWSYKGKKDTFDNFLKFQDSPYIAKFTWIDSDDFYLLAQNLEYREKRFLSAKQQLEEYDKANTIYLMDKKDKKTVHETLMESIREVRNKYNLGVPE